MFLRRVLHDIFITIVGLFGNYYFLGFANISKIWLRGEIDISAGDSVLSVNNIVLNKQFSLIKPSVHILQDPYFFVDNVVDSNYKQLKLKTFKVLNEINWDLFLYVPFEYKMEAENCVINKNIRILTLPKYYYLTKYFRLFLLQNLSSRYWRSIGIEKFNVGATSIYMVERFSNCKNIKIYGLSLNYYQNLCCVEKNAAYISNNTCSFPTLEKNINQRVSVADELIRWAYIINRTQELLLATKKKYSLIGDVDRAIYVK